MTGPATTQYRKVEKPFSWSYSRIKNFETCPKRYYEVDVAKNVQEEDSDQLAFGNKLHSAFAAYLSKGTPLPPDLITYQEDVDRVAGMNGTMLVEQKLAITKDFGPCDYFARNAWFRAQGDVLRIAGRVAYCGDWKTGKVKEDSVQLALVAACVFAHHPAVLAVKTEFIWINEGAATPQVFRREDMPTFWATFLGRVRDLEQAHKTTSFPAKPGGLCRRYCPVRSCPHYGGE
jgi:hypothetical protein